MVLEWSKNDEKIRKLAKACNNWMGTRVTFWTISNYSTLLALIFFFK